MGGFHVAFSKYENGYGTQSGPMGKLIKIVRDHPHILGRLAADAGVALKSSQRMSATRGRRKTDAIQFPPGFSIVEGLPVFGVFRALGEIKITEESLEDASQSAAA